MTDRIESSTKNLYTSNTSDVSSFASDLEELLNQAQSGTPDVQDLQQRIEKLKQEAKALPSEAQQYIQKILDDVSSYLQGVQSDLKQHVEEAIHQLNNLPSKTFPDAPFVIKDLQNVTNALGAQAWDQVKQVAGNVIDEASEYADKETARQLEKLADQASQIKKHMEERVSEELKRVSDHLPWPFNKKH